MPNLCLVAPLVVSIRLAHVAGRSTALVGTSPVVTKRHRAISSLRARATIMVLRSAPRTIPPRRWLLEHEPTPRQLDHAAANPCIACPGQPFFPALAAAFVRSPCNATVARHRPLVPQVAREHFMDQHVGCFHTDTHDPGQHQQHRMCTFPRRLLQRCQPRHLTAQFGQRVGAAARLPGHAAPRVVEPPSSA